MMLERWYFYRSGETDPLYWRLIAGNSGSKVVRQEGRLCFVASVGVAEDYAVYYSDDPNDIPGEVATNGLKTTQALGEAMFPELAQRLTWRK